MFEVKQLFCFADPTFFEDVSRWTDGPGLLRDAEFSAASRQLPPGWTRNSRSIWTRYMPPDHQLPAQGWKVHVSATLDNADKLCTIVMDYCLDHGIAFKHLLNRNVLLAMNAKYSARGSSGKLLTLYPTGDAELARVLADLNDRCAGEPGPYILSDLRYADGPLYVRYGGFTSIECLDENGEWAQGVVDPDGVVWPDRRRPFFDPPTWAPRPAVLEPQLAARKRGGSALPYRVKRALHFSNAGGIYVAERISDGRKVVLKEARPHAALDENHEDAVARQHRERRALELLAGVDGVPQLYDSFEAGGHHFFAQEFIEGQPLHVWYAVHHPWVARNDATDADLAEYTRRAVRIVTAIGELVERIHARGVTYNDLHLGNVIVRPDESVALVDFELSAHIDENWRPGLRATGFGTRAKTGFALDRYSLAAIRLGIFFTSSRISALQPAKVFDFVRALADNFPVPAHWPGEILAELAPPEPADGPTVSPVQALRRAGLDFDAPVVDWPAILASMSAGILASATPDRTERLFPGAVEQFGTGGGFDVAHGAAGVLWTLAETGHGRHLDHERWLLDGVTRATRLRPGFYDGAAGIAYVLDRLGHPETADTLLAAHVGDGTAHHGMSLYSGLPGIGASLLHFAAARNSTAHRDAAAAIAARLTDAVDSGEPHRLLPAGRTPSGKPVKAGLMYGWSGVALFLCRLHESTGDAGYLDVAVRAMHRDLDLCTPADDDGALMVEEAGVRMLPYLDVGSAGIALVADELLRLRDDDRVQDSLPKLLIPVRRRYAVQADLFGGFASQIATLARLNRRYPLDDALDRSLRTLSWHALTYRGELAFPGSLGFRLSMDLASGSAGVLLAVAAGTRPEAPFLPFFAPAASLRRDRP